MNKQQQFVDVSQGCEDFNFPSVMTGAVSTRVSNKTCENCFSAKRGICENSFRNNVIENRSEI